MSRSLTRLAPLLALLTASPVQGASWSVGSHLGIDWIRSDVRNSGSSTVLAWPANAFTYQPGLRLGVGDARHAHEVLIDTGLFLLDESGSTLSLFAASANYQHTFLASPPNAPFANLGLGLLREGGAARAQTAASYGAGVGVRHRVRDGRGVLRGELRADYLTPAHTLGRPGLITLGLRLGFDLWL